MSTPCNECIPLTFGPARYVSSLSPSRRIPVVHVHASTCLSEGVYIEIIGVGLHIWRLTGRIILHCSAKMYRKYGGIEVVQQSCLPVKGMGPRKGVQSDKVTQAQ